MDNQFVAISDDNGKRIDAFVSEHIEDITRNAVQNLLEQGYVLVNDKKAKKSLKLKENDVVIVNRPQIKPCEIVPEDMPLDIIYEDEDLLVVNKPKGMVVHPAPGNPSGTLVNGLAFHCKDNLSVINGEERPGIVHRIDKDTSGLLMVAKSDKAHVGLSEQLAEHSSTRLYRAVVYGNLKTDFGTIDAPIGRHPVDRKRMAINQKNGKHAVTTYTVLGRGKGFTYVELKLLTGRTHQIRVHMASIGHPLAGDLVYGPKKVISKLNGQCLHAKTLGFIHPIKGEYMEFDSNLPEYFEDFLRSAQVEELTNETM